MLFAPTVQQFVRDRMPHPAGQWVAAGGEQFLAATSQSTNPLQNFGLALIYASLLLGPLLATESCLLPTDLLAQHVDGLSQFRELWVE